MKLHWTPEAITNREAIYDYIEAESPVSAIALDELFTEQCHRLIHHSSLGRPGRVAGTRELVVHRHYVLVYDVTTDLIRILGILHTARQWPPRP